ncbi:MAG: Txe/YoeB family addiction module toxin [Bacteroides ovatus]|mgnify:CR=1 FL=1|jgi:toxin YoeB|uniref:Txe/YoeB family addiction module toxin n=1 Tax=Bacteroides sp. TaxID=29523 RepID=UPI0025F197A9|nr:Txe/YoeB family addiction module toxin [Prevotella sp.]
MEESNITYTLEFDEQALKDIQLLKKSEKQAYNKLLKLLDELTEHPTTGTGKPEVLKFGLSGFYSRRITQKHRLVYKVDNEQITVLIISAIGHYSDK